jgi:hypothetical protein
MARFISATLSGRTILHSFTEFGRREGLFKAFAYADLTRPQIAVPDGREIRIDPEHLLLAVESVEIEIGDRGNRHMQSPAGFRCSPWMRL